MLSQVGKQKKWEGVFRAGLGRALSTLDWWKVHGRVG